MTYGPDARRDCTAPTEGDMATKVNTYIEGHGNPIVDGEMTVAELLAAQVNFHLPAHVRQIQDLAV